MVLPSLLSAMTQQQHSFVTATNCAFVYMRVRFCVYVGGVCAVIGEQNDYEERSIVFEKAAAQHKE